MHAVSTTIRVLKMAAPYEDISDSDEDEDECRVCRGPAEEG